MPLRLFNTLTNEKQDFTPVRPGRIGVYVCGITVYDLAHIGHARMLTAFDAAVRALRWMGWQVNFVRNWTDVDDKIIRRAGERGEDPQQFAARYIDECRRDMQALNILPADVEPKATENIPEMIEIISKLIERGHAYASAGDVYFSVRSFPDYGKLSKRNLDDLQSGARVEPGEQKHDPLDFALWKAAKPGEPASVTWQSPWGPGRPGWHIECSAMSQKYLGVTFDVHGGGKDLVFPHHENEIAQSEAASGQELAHYWLHNGFVTLDAEKMSKSMGNFKTIRDLLAHWDGEALRAFLLSTHYRHPINFTESAVADADRRVEYFYETLAKGDAYLTQKKFTAGEPAPVDEHVAAFRDAMDDDFNTADAMARVERLYHVLNASIDAKAPPAEVAALLHTARTLSHVLGLAPRAPLDAIRERRTLAAARKGIKPADVEQLIAERIAARKAKDFKTADAIRMKLTDAGVELRDGSQGTDWRVLL
ncbi:MAG: cysteine--tRNA ligase [Deltaproteobacteria bacterium]|nr:MAG: cysteine--tRNA ligase [Deltaproteobacteria bacterium]